MLRFRPPKDTNLERSVKGILRMNELIKMVYADTNIAIAQSA